MLALSCAEVALRLSGFEELATHLYRRDPCCGFSLRPGARGVWKSEGTSTVAINSRGLRDHEHSLRKPRGTMRVAILGDSYAEALQVPMEQAFWSVLERELASCRALAGRVAEAVNFGVSGYGTAQELQTLRTRVWEYEPDAVVLAFTTGNDVRNNSRVLEPEQMRPFFVLEQGRLVLDDRFLADPRFEQRSLTRNQWALGLIGSSRLLQLLVTVERRVRSQTREGPGARSERLGTVAGSSGLDGSVYRFPPTAEWDEAWSVTESLIATVENEVRDRGRQFLLVISSAPQQVSPDREARDRFRAELGAEDLFYPDRRLERFAETRGIDHLTLAPRLLDWAERHGECVHGFPNAEPCGGHWNATGHRLAGEMIAAELCQMSSR